MELVKKSIHTERIKAKAVLQIPMEEDINVSDTRPDVGKLVYHGGKVKIDEVKTGSNKVWVKGKLVYNILYQADDKETKLAGMEGELPFMEEINMEQVEVQDRAVCMTELEDMRVNMINSRKLSIQAVISFMPHVEETLVEEVCTDLSNQEENQKLEYRKKELSFLEAAVSKRDLFRIHEETKLPTGMPNMGTVFWKSADINHVSFRPMEERVGVSGDIRLFIMYEEESGGKSNWYETTIPFTGSVDCQGCRENMVADIAYEVGHEEISIREDSDGETRQIGVEMTLEMEIKLLEQETTSIVADVYGVTCEVDAVTDKKEFRRLHNELHLEEKLSHIMTLDPSRAKILQICHQDASLELKEYSLKNDTITMQGNMYLRLLYLTSEDSMGYELLEEMYPFEITRQMVGIDSDMECALRPQIEQLQVAIKDGNQVEWRAVISVQLLVFGMQQENILSEVRISQLDSEKIERLPGFAIYFAQEGDSLWQIGKKYYVSVEKIKEVNQLTTEEIKAGDRLLIVKSGEVN